MMIGSTAVQLTFALTCVLAWLAGNAQADFGSGTITFEEDKYQLYYDTSGAGTNLVPYTSANRGGATQPSGVNGSGEVTVADDQIVPIDAWFQVQTSGGDNVYVRFGFDLDGDGDLDSADTPAVLEGTYGGTSDEQGTTSPSYVGPSEIFAYTSAVGSDVNADYIESGYESQAGSFFVRARKDNNGDSTETNDSGDQESWTSFIIEYAGAAVSEATGEIWDIDAGGSGAERFAVTVTGNSASVTDGTYTVTENSPTGLLETNASSLDAKPWQFSFGSADGFTDIDQIKITRFTGTGYTSFFPLAFNNFNPVSAVGFVTPEPSSLLAFGGIFSLALLRRRHLRGRG